MCFVPLNVLHVFRMEEQMYFAPRKEEIVVDSCGQPCPTAEESIALEEVIVKEDDKVFTAILEQRKQCFLCDSWLPDSGIPFGYLDAQDMHTQALRESVRDFKKLVDEYHEGRKKRLHDEQSKEEAAVGKLTRTTTTTKLPPFTDEDETPAAVRRKLTFVSDDKLVTVVDEGNTWTVDKVKIEKCECRPPPYTQE